MFCLKQYDTPLLTFDIVQDALDGQRCVIASVNEDAENLLPIGMPLTNQGLKKWLRSRIIPSNRAFVDSFLAKSGLSRSDLGGILRISRGLSLNDSYWIVENGFDGKFSDFNLFEHEFVRALSLIAYTGYGSTKLGGFSSSPEFTTGGMLRKGWRRKDGKIVLYKGGTWGAANTGNEPYSEYYAAQIAEQMGLNHVSYGLAKWKKCLCSTCELFSDIDHSFVPMAYFVQDGSLREASWYLRKLGEGFHDAFADMLIFDALICNEDRHFGNFGLMVDNRTNRPCAFAPIFDNGLSLFNYAMEDDFDHLDCYAKTRSSAYGVPFESIVREFMTPRQKQELRRMIGFTFSRHRRYNLPIKRLKAMEGYLQARVRQFLSAPEKQEEP